jgi:hypothetical protein
VRQDTVAVYKGLDGSLARAFYGIWPKYTVHAVHGPF